MQRIFKKNQHGFTLAELLIVVAIIAVLVAVSIPIFTSKLESSREAVDASNMRAAYGIAAADLLSGSYKDDAVYTEANGVYTSYYDASTGVMSIAKVAAYGKSQIADFQGATPDLPAQCSSWTGQVNTGNIVQVTITPAADGDANQIEVSWVAGATGG